MGIAEYNLIRDVIKNQPTKAIEVHFKKDPGGTVRYLWPHVIGTSSNPDTGNVEQVVLCYQYDGQTPPNKPLVTPHPKRHNFRCFKVDDLINPQPITFVPTPPPPPPPPAWKPFKLKPKQVKRQNCVETVDVSR